ncbi:hypothetical protein F4805DRAFT_183199 [Annulohypoxylon moriforme]|nr:hypothetical protein F4805DRAFT_183199 [Annulohypoxylon moriforme]
MMSFPDTVSGLLRALLLSLRAIGSTNRAPKTGGGSSGADFYAAELELQPWPATSSTTRKSAKSATVTTRCAENRNRHEFQLPDLPRSLVVHRRSGRVKTNLTSRATSFESDVSSQSSGGTDDSLERSTTKSRWDAARYRRAARKKQQASQLCWRGYWG